MTVEEFEILHEQLKLALRVYKSKQGTYKDGYWKDKLENKVASSINVLTSLIKYYEDNQMLTEAQIPLAKKMIRNSVQLGREQ